MAEFNLVCILDDVESLALDLFPVDQGTNLCLQILDGDERSLLKVGLQECEFRARKMFKLRIGSGYIHHRPRRPGLPQSSGAFARWFFLG